jgi:putative lipoprotein
MEGLLQEKIKAGMEFYGVGQEPGWSLEMDMENIFSFRSYDGVEMNTPPVAGVNKGGVTVYRMQVEMGEMIITLVETECSDIMSGQKFPYQVSVNIKRGVDSTYREYNGCGRMLK